VKHFLVLISFIRAEKQLALRTVEMILGIRFFHRFVADAIYLNLKKKKKKKTVFLSWSHCLAF